MFEELLKGLLLKMEPIVFGQTQQIRMGFKPWFIVRLCLRVNGANLLTNITAKHPVIEFAFLVGWQYFIF
jgi:hypothetical protein